MFSIATTIRAGAATALIGLATALLVPDSPAASSTSWSDLIAPLRVGEVVTRGYVLSPPRRGEAHDVVYVARREADGESAAARVEVHIVDRGKWAGIAETASFGVAWEVPRPGALVVAPAEDAEAVTQALVAAVGANDTGFASVDSIPLTGEPAPPLITRVLDRIDGARGWAIASAAITALLLLNSLRGGAWVVAIVLFVVGIGLRAPVIDLPFSHDQDVQRMFTGNSTLAEIATGVGLQDRHPPLYFLVLHLAQRFGQSEAIGRAPAVLAGALVGPAVLLAAASLRGGVAPPAVLLALAATISPVMIARSREVSEIPLYSIFLIGASASLVAALRRPTTARLAAVVAFHALALFTYYLAPFVVVAHTLVLAWKGAERRLWAALAGGVVCGSPALLLAAATLIRDWSARETARAFPALAWGEHAPLQMAGHMTRIGVESVGLPLAILIAAAIAAGAARRELPPVVAGLGFAATFAGIALLSPFARVQAYYVTTALPLALLAASVWQEPSTRRARLAYRLALAIAVVFGTAPLLRTVRTLYLPNADAFMPRFAEYIRTRPEETVVTVAHYDKSLLAYYLARSKNRSIAWHTVDDPAGPRIESLVLVHSLRATSEEEAALRFDQLVASDGPLLVIERDAFLLPPIVERLNACETLLTAPTARLVRCESTGAANSLAGAG